MRAVLAALECHRGAGLQRFVTFAASANGTLPWRLSWKPRLSSCRCSSMLRKMARNCSSVSPRRSRLLALVSVLGIGAVLQGGGGFDPGDILLHRRLLADLPPGRVRVRVDVVVKVACRRVGHALRPGRSRRWSRPARRAPSPLPGLRGQDAVSSRMLRTRYGVVLRRSSTSSRER